jgi:hypothetical protein
LLAVQLARDRVRQLRVGGGKTGGKEGSVGRKIGDRSTRPVQGNTYEVRDNGALALGGRSTRGAYHISGTDVSLLPDLASGAWAGLVKMSVEKQPHYPPIAKAQALCNRRRSDS